MESKWIKLSIAILWMPISILIFTFSIPIFTDLPILYFSDQIYEYFEIPIFKIRDVAALIAIGIFPSLYFFYEIKNFLTPTSSRILKHLRFGPLAVFFVFLVTVIAFDQGMIAYSKYRILNYIHHSSDHLEPPDLRLHNNYRGWCGNGYIAYENYLYFDTASSGLLDENEYVRARSLFASHKVSNLFNGGDERYELALSKACQDDSQIVREVSAELLANRNSSCASFISKFPLDQK